ncbi:hypothetical protein [Petroclostridium sp. X23]|uniref:hypothetical protein n=1 Tax=Petroclostridium sp. X23 TaxID=3045146 RepID=UPI0024AD9939|nr:hypothetical protein [Petroclostridium sp. X23]WHH59147.1 hypothetical protein QKW49_25735 [Petroclostridium sp. X23]
MGTDQLPDKIIELDILRINRNIDKKCKCNRWERKFTVDTTNKKVYCNCGAEVDPYEALEDLARNRERIVEENKRLYEQRKQIIDYKPWLLVFRDLESQYRSKMMLPACPHCGRGFFFEELRSWTNRQLEIKRREKEKGDNDG